MKTTDRLRVSHKVPFGLASSGVPFGPMWGAWVDCIECGRRDQIRGAEASDSDARLRKAFEGAGWSISPTLCPDHAGVLLAGRS